MDREGVGRGEERREREGVEFEGGMGKEREGENRKEGWNSDEGATRILVEEPLLALHTSHGS